MTEENIIDHERQINRKMRKRIWPNRKRPDSSRLQLVLAERRTGQALQRNFLANERTFSAWVRTGMAAVVSGLGIGKLLSDYAEWAIVVDITAVLFILTGTLIYLIALWRYRQDCALLEQTGLTMTPRWLYTLVMGALLVNPGLALVLVFKA